MTTTELPDTSYSQCMEMAKSAMELAYQASAHYESDINQEIHSHDRDITAATREMIVQAKRQFAMAQEAYDRGKSKFTEEQIRYEEECLNAIYRILEDAGGKLDELPDYLDK